MFWGLSSDYTPNVKRQNFFFQLYIDHKPLNIKKKTHWNWLRNINIIVLFIQRKNIAPPITCICYRSVLLSPIWRRCWGIAATSWHDQCSVIVYTGVNHVNNYTIKIIPGFYDKIWFYNPEDIILDGGKNSISFGQKFSVHSVSMNFRGLGWGCESTTLTCESFYSQ